MKTRKVFCLYNDGDHIDCFETELEAEGYAHDNNIRMYDIEEEEYEPNCDCGNQRIKG